MQALDIPSVRAFALVAQMQNFTRAAEALGTTQASVSMKLQRLEAVLGKRLLDRSPRAVRLTADGIAFRDHATTLLDAHDRAFANPSVARATLTLGISDHAAGAELVPLLARMRNMAAQLTLSVTIGFSRSLLDAFDAGDLDALVIRQEGSRRGGERLVEDSFGWFAAPDLQWTRGTALPLASLAAPCGVRATAIRALDKSGIGWSEAFIGGGVSAVSAAALAGLGIAPLAARIAPRGLIDVGPQFGLPRLPRSKVMLYGRASDPTRRDALRLLSAAFRAAAPL